MHVVFLDPSAVYDATTPSLYALGGRQKAVVAVAEGLARRGHRVEVFTRTSSEVRGAAEGAVWRPWAALPSTSDARADAVVAVADPSLFSAYSEGSPILWGPLSGAIWSREVMTVFSSYAAARKFSAVDRFAVIAPGVGADFRPDDETARAPVAVVTTHPRHRLEEIVRAWGKGVRPHVPDARLQVFSRLLSAAPPSEEPEDYAQLRALIAENGGEVVAPVGDREMAEAYRTASLHLYPTTGEEDACWTLAESQACGLPAVALAGGAAEERIVSGATGFLVGDVESMMNVARELLGNTGIVAARAAEAADPARRRSWSAVVFEFERVLTGSP